MWNLYVSLAYSVTEDHQYEQDCIARVEFVSESESNDPEAYIGVYQPLDESAKERAILFGMAVSPRNCRTLYTLGLHFIPYS